jgi:hypothetical protein
LSAPKRSKRPQGGVFDPAAACEFKFRPFAQAQTHFDPPKIGKLLLEVQKVFGHYVIDISITKGEQQSSCVKNPIRHDHTFFQPISASKDKKPSGLPSRCGNVSI